MKKTIFFVALFLSVGVWGCDDKEKNNENTKECFKSYKEKLYNKNFSIEGIVKYSEYYKEYVVVYDQDDAHWFSTEHLFCPNLGEKYCKEGLRVKVEGEHYLGAKPESDGSDPKGGLLLEVWRFKNYKIIKIK